ncbi:nucleoside hydrolase [Dyadobacter sp. 32]|uniref:nucleoside hydrolase n=1 Tax=Dyadobacter sp. 32 TaxID=538966 RepID=UPI0011EE2E8C
MKTVILSFLLSCLLTPVFSQKNDVTAPLSVILDTDMDSDVDDVGALAMLHAYEKRGMLKILGVIVTSDEKYSAPCTEAINTYFGRPDLPIGVSQRDSPKVFSKYTRQIAEQFPHHLASNAEAKTSTAVYRQLLANASDKSVVIITIGHLTSLSRLINSLPDSISPLYGLELIAKKVKSWSCMGGQFPSGKEANFYRPDPLSTVDCLAKWTLPVTFSGWEAGNVIITGGESFKTRNKPSSPVYQAYLHYNGFKGRASWDQVAILEAVEAPGKYLAVERNGYCKVTMDGRNEWQPFASRFKHGYVRFAVPLPIVQNRIDELMAGF